MFRISLALVSDGLYPSFSIIQRLRLSLENTLGYSGCGKWKSFLKRQFNLFKVSSLKNDTLFYGVAVLAERLIGLLIISLLTKTLSQEFYGIWTQMIVTTGLLSPIVLMGFYSAAVRFLEKESPTIICQFFQHFSQNSKWRES